MKGVFYASVYFQDTCPDAHERSGSSKLIWECYTSYLTSINIIFGSLYSLGGYFQWVELQNVFRI